MFPTEHGSLSAVLRLKTLAFGAFKLNSTHSVFALEKKNMKKRNFFNNLTSANSSKKNKSPKKRRLTLEPLESREMLSVTYDGNDGAAEFVSYSENAPWENSNGEELSLVLPEGIADCQTENLPLATNGLNISPNDYSWTLLKRDGVGAEHDRYTRVKGDCTIPEGAVIRIEIDSRIRDINETNIHSAIVDASLSIDGYGRLQELERLVKGQTHTERFFQNTNGTYAKFYYDLKVCPVYLDSSGTMTNAEISVYVGTPKVTKHGNIKASPITFDLSKGTIDFGYSYKGESQASGNELELTLKAMGGGVGSPTHITWIAPSSLYDGKSEKFSYPVSTFFERYKSVIPYSIPGPSPASSTPIVVTKIDYANWDTSKTDNTATVDIPNVKISQPKYDETSGKLTFTLTVDKTTNAGLTGSATIPIVISAITPSNSNGTEVARVYLNAEKLKQKGYSQQYSVSVSNSNATNAIAYKVEFDPGNKLLETDEDDNVKRTDIPIVKHGNLTALPVAFDLNNGTIVAGYRYDGDGKASGGNLNLTLGATGNGVLAPVSLDDKIDPKTLVSGTTKETVYGVSTFFNKYQDVLANSNAQVKVEISPANWETSATDNTAAANVPNVEISELKYSKTSQKLTFAVKVLKGTNAELRGADTIPIAVYAIDSTGKETLVASACRTFDVGKIRQQGCQQYEVPVSITNAVAYKVVFDPNNKLLENNENDNIAIASVDPAKTNITAIRLDGNSTTVAVDYAVNYYKQGVKTSVQFNLYWSNSSTFNKSTAVFAQSASRDPLTKSGSTVDFDLADLGRSWRGERYLYVCCTTTLINTTESTETVQSTDVSLKNGSLYGVMDKIANPGAPAVVRLASWLNQNSATIKRIAENYNISATAITGAIAYHAMNNSQASLTYLADLDPASYDVSFVESHDKRTKKNKTPLTRYSSVSARDAALSLTVKNTAGTESLAPNLDARIEAQIKYVAAIMRTYRNQIRGVFTSAERKALPSSVKTKVWNPNLLVSLY